MWPGGAGKALLDVDNEQLSTWQRCPIDYDKLKDFVEVYLLVGVREISRRYRLVHTHPVADQGSPRVPITLRIQGFISSKNLRPLGNWDG